MRIILLTLFVLFARVAEAQDYLPMLTDGKEWHCMEDVKYSQRDGVSFNHQSGEGHYRGGSDM